MYRDNYVEACAGCCAEVPAWSLADEPRGKSWRPLLWRSAVSMMNNPGRKQKNSPGKKKADAPPRDFRGVGLG